MLHFINAVLVKKMTIGKVVLMRICYTGLLLVSGGIISSDLILACSDDSYEYT